MQGFWLSPSVSVTLERGLKSWQRLIRCVPQERDVVRPTTLVLILLLTVMLTVLCYLCGLLICGVNARIKYSARPPCAEGSRSWLEH